MWPAKYIGSRPNLPWRRCIADQKHPAVFRAHGVTNSARKELEL